MYVSLQWHCFCVGTHTMYRLDVCAYVRHLSNVMRERTGLAGSAVCRLTFSQNHFRKYGHGVLILAMKEGRRERVRAPVKTFFGSQIKERTN